MRVGPKFSTVLLAMWPFGGEGAEVRAGSTPEERVDAVLHAKGFEGGQWGLLVVDSSHGAGRSSSANADKMFCPASVTKLYSTRLRPSLTLGPTIGSRLRWSAGGR